MTQTTGEIGIQTEESDDKMQIEKPLSFRLVDCRKLKKLVRYEKIYKIKIGKMLVEPIVSPLMKLRKLKVMTVTTK